MSSPTAPGAGGPEAPGSDSPTPFQLDGVILLGIDGGNPLQVEGITLTFGHEGVGVIHGHQDHPRLLPWSLLTAYALEAWSGAITPPWWVDPELNRSDDGSTDGGKVIDTDSTTRSPPHTEAGALISFRTPVATYRFLLPGGDPGRLFPLIAAFVRAHRQGEVTTGPVTVFAGHSPPVELHGPAAAATGPNAMDWTRIRPVLTVFLIVCLATIAILIVLQSAGTVHLPILGGASPGTVGGIRFR